MQVSFVRSLTMDAWTTKQLLSMQRGGNSKFRNFMANYYLDAEPLSTKYKTRAAEYYRKRVMSRGKSGV